MLFKYFIDETTVYTHHYNLTTTEMFFKIHITKQEFFNARCF